MATHPILESIDQDILPPELAAELEKEIARNLEATRLLKEREQQALEARERAADSHRRMQNMMSRFEEMRRKLEWTRLTLAETTSRIQKHDAKRENRIRESVTQLKARAQNYAEKLREQHLDVVEQDDNDCDPSNESSSTSSSLQRIQTPGDDGCLTETEKLLLLMCQESAGNLSSDQTSEEVNAKLKETSNAKRTHDYAKTVRDIQERYGNKAKLTKPTGPSCQQLESNSSPSGGKNSYNNKDDKDGEQEGEEVKCDHVTLKVSDFTDTFVNDVNKEVSENVSLASGLFESEMVDQRTVGMQENKVDDDGGINVNEVTMDLNEAVVKIEAKCAGVREELGQMAVTEQYMRTKQAQLLAKRKEKEAAQSLAIALEKEKEANEMRKKVAEMTKLLSERKNKLVMAENVLEKKSSVVDKVNKLLDSKLRKAHYVQKHKVEVDVFDKQLHD